MWKPQQNGWKVEEIFQSGANRQRQKIGEKDRVRNLAQDCIICKQKDFYKGKQNKTKKNPQENGRDKNQRNNSWKLSHLQGHVSKDWATKCPAQWVKPDPTTTRLYEILEHWWQKENSLFQASRQETEITCEGTRNNMALHSTEKRF